MVLRNSSTCSGLTDTRRKHQSWGSPWGGAAVAASYMTLYRTPSLRLGEVCVGFLALCCALCSVLGFVLCRRVRGAAVIPFANCKKVFYICVPLSFDL